MHFRSKADISIIVIFIIGIVTLLISTISELLSDQSLFLKIFLTIVLSLGNLFFVSSLVNTRYIVTNQYLIIWFALLKRKIPLSEISQINNVGDLITSPALSLDRIEIIHHQTKKLYVSPKNKIEFVNTLKSYNSNIMVNEGLQTLY